MSQRLSLMTMRWTHDLVLLGAMCRYRPSPSPCRPGSFSVFTEGVVSFPIVPPFPHFFLHSKRDVMAFHEVWRKTQGERIRDIDMNKRQMRLIGT